MLIGMVLDLMKSPKHGSLCLQTLSDREVSPYVLPKANLLSIYKQKFSGMIVQLICCRSNWKQATGMYSN